MTVNQINNLFKDFARRNPMLNDYEFGTSDNIGASRNLLYPYMWVFLIGSEDADNGMSELNHYRIFFFDKISFSENNQVEIISDMQYVYQQFLAEFRSSIWYDTALQNNRTSATVLVNATDANLAGWQLDIYLKQMVTVTPCNSPQLPPTENTTGLEGVDYWIIEDTFIVS